MSAAASSGDTAPDARLVRVEGQQRRRMVPGPLKVLQILSGYLVLRWVAWALGRYVLGYRVESRLEFRGDRLVYHSATHLLGRQIGTLDETYLVGDLVALGVERRFPHLLLLLGALGLIGGATFGITAVIDGIQASYLAISLVGLAVLTCGVLLDIGLGALAGFLGTRTSVLVTLRVTPHWWSGRRFRICGVEEGRAHDFVNKVTGTV